jgi:DNA-binding HxlR family transcriptional regulator
VRSYKQFCSLAKTLDVIGERWTMLVLRELMLRGASRYTDLRDGLPGIATNLLAERLRDLEQAGLVAREEAPPPVATTLYRLTPRGEELRPALVELAQWGMALMPDAPDDDSFRGHWLELPVELHLADREPDGPPMTIEVRTGGAPMLIESVDGAVRTRSGTAEHPDLLISGPPKLVLGTLIGKVGLQDAAARGLQYEGDPSALARLQPPGAAVTEAAGPRP